MQTLLIVEAVGVISTTNDLLEPENQFGCCDNCKEICTGGVAVNEHLVWKKSISVVLKKANASS